MDDLTMDEVKNPVDDLMFDEVKRPFPDSDYDKKGRLKTVRGRILKKLLKYEFKAILPSLFVALAILACATMVMCVLNATDTVRMKDPFNAFGFTVIMIMLYVYALGASVITPFAVAWTRYEKNFFKGEGYLTFSIPATAEEHILAKHISAMVSVLIGFAGMIVSIAVLALFSRDGGYDSGETIHFLKGFSNVMYVIEQVLLTIIGFVSTYFIMGALTCFAQKFDKKGSFILRFVLAYVLITVIIAVVTGVGGTKLANFFLTEVGMHVGSCLSLLLETGIGLFCFWYERRTLKEKLNLK